MWLTVIADGIWTGLRERTKGLQTVVGTDYHINAFVSNIASGIIRIKAKNVALLVGNEQLAVGMTSNLAKQMEKLVRQICIAEPLATIFVSSVFPKPTQETVTQALVMKTNEKIGQMCRKLTKYGHNIVKYMPLHQHVLEKWRHTDHKSGKMRISTRIVQPHGKYFVLGTDRLNQEGLDMITQNMLAFVRVELQLRAPLIERPHLKVQIENDTVVPKNSVRKESGGKNASRKDRRFSPLTGPKRKNEGKNMGRVSRMVDKWEQLSQGPVVDDIDLELGEDSVVQVDLGDQQDRPGPGDPVDVQDE